MTILSKRNYCLQARALVSTHWRNGRSGVSFYGVSDEEFVDAHGCNFVVRSNLLQVVLLTCNQRSRKDFEQ